MRSELSAACPHIDHGEFTLCEVERGRRAAAQDRYKRLIGDLYAAEEAARKCEREGNEGDADAIWRDAIRSALKLGLTDGSLPLFADLWKRHE